MNFFKHLKPLRTTCCLGLLVASTSFTALAAEVPENSMNLLNYEVTDATASKEVYVEYLNEFLRGKKPPTGSSFIDLKNNTITCNVEKLTVSLYSNSLFSGVKTINVSIPEITVNKNGMQNKNGPVTVTLYKKKGSKVASETVETEGGSAEFSGLDSNTVYYLGFTKANDSQIYSFEAHVSGSN